MRRLLFIIISILLVVNISSCKTEEDPTNDNPDVLSLQIDSTLKPFFPNTTDGFETIFNYNFPFAINPFSINLYWYDPEEKHGIYWHFNNNDGDVLTDANGFAKAFDSGVTIDSTMAGTWSGNSADGILSYDYVANPAANKGNLAGQGDKYIAFRAINDVSPHLKYYGWLRVKVSENGRQAEIISIGFQKNPNTSLRTGEL